MKRLVAAGLIGLVFLVSALHAEASMMTTLSSWLDKHDLKYEKVGERTYSLAFESNNHPNLFVFVMVSKKGDYVSIFSPVMKVPEDAPKSFYQHLLELNENLWQAKFGLDSDNQILYFEFEVPTRLIDEEEFISDIALVAKKVDELYPTLAKKAGLSKQ
ncbi:MAG: hypothetical protein DRQ10_04845 [Candidatus Hydrothermota bacterium]|nr:MAG: hypothetical protein DRQ10_04845 [Candidatus Hydrothermae bacterium]